MVCFMSTWRSRNVWADVVGRAPPSREASVDRELESIDSSPPEFARKEGLERTRSRPATGRGVESEKVCILLCFLREAIRERIRG